MRRREFITLLGGAAAAATLRPHPLTAQQSGRIYLIGFFGRASCIASGEHRHGRSYPAFRDELRKHGFIDRSNLVRCPSCTLIFEFKRRHAVGDLWCFIVHRVLL